jgi:hypothetical protein
MEHNPKFDEMYDFDLNGVQIRWPHLFKPDTAYESVWSVDIILPEKLAADMAKVGFLVKETEVDGEKVKFIKAKRKTHKKDGSPMYPPRVYDSGTPDRDPQKWDPNIAIGNGSVCNVKVAARYLEVGGKTRLPLYLNSVQVVNHVPYNNSPFSAVSKDNNPF